MNMSINHRFLIGTLCASFLLTGCVTNYLPKSSVQPPHTSPTWADQGFLEKETGLDPEVEYADSGMNTTMGHKANDGLRSDLVYDHVDQSISRLTDYSRPRSQTKSVRILKKASGKKQSDSMPWLKGFKATDKKRRTGLQDNVNIVVNHMEPTVVEKDPKSMPKTALSRIEDRYNRYGELSRSKKIRQFGYDLIRHKGTGQPLVRGTDSLIQSKKGTHVFSQDEATRLFAGSRDGKKSYESGDYAGLRPVSAEYIIAPGDEVFVKITGPVDIAEVYVVDRNGQLFIPKIGAIRLAGKTASQLSRVVSKKTRTVFKSALVEVSLGRLRSIQITVTGNVAAPGLIQVPANSSLLNALAAAGGPTKAGTLRQIQLRRRHHDTRMIDLYAVLMDGDFKQDPPLLPGDVIYVGPVGPTVAMISPGDKGAIYEILKDSRLGSLSAMAGLTGSFTDVDTILVEKGGHQADRNIVALDFKDQADTHALSDGDIFQFFPTHAYSYNSISVTGPVLRQGA